MSLQFGNFRFDKRPLDTRYIDQVRAMLARFSPDPEGAYSDASVEIVYRAFHTSEESRREKQPRVSDSGVVVTWDGRLDNRKELIAEIGRKTSDGLTDVEIVTAAYDSWGTGCFRKLIGDWAMSLWIPRADTVVLAADFVGTRHLYYRITEDQVTWSTILDPLILLARQSFGLEEEYVAGWLSFFPAPHLTPYRGVLAVPPCSYVRVSKQGWHDCKYWDFDPGKRIRYRTDAEYEEHFRSVFKGAVKRRLRSDSPVLAELSGGVDSSSIVCVADEILAHENGQQLETVSYYDESEPNWDERSFFSQIEGKRGRTGRHINLHKPDQQEARSFTPYDLSPARAGRNSDAYLQLASCLKRAGHRVLLSGIGGDEVLGGVPNPIPELADLLASGRIGEFSRQLKLWALSLRKPWIHLLRDTLLLFSPSSRLLFSSSDRTKYPTWVDVKFVARNQRALEGYGSRVKIFGPPPSVQVNLITLEALRRQLASLVLPTDPLHEVRYPYLDRDLLEFLYAIPRQQLVRPNERRSLMRRALKGLVPDQVLNRRRKAFVIRSPIITVSRELERIAGTSELTMSALGVVDKNRLLDEMRRAMRGADVAIVPLLRAFTLEDWLTALIGGKVLSGAASC
jgi:asparagine synthase (glutamine-hydrolysing)